MERGWVAKWCWYGIGPRLRRSPGGLALGGPEALPICTYTLRCLAAAQHSAVLIHILADKAPAMFSFIKMLLLASLAVQAVYGAKTVHLIVDGKEVRQCTTIPGDLSSFRLNHPCNSIVETGKTEVGCVTGKGNMFTIMNRFVASCNQANGKLADLPDSQTVVNFYVGKDLKYICSNARTQYVYSNFNLDPQICFGPAQHDLNLASAGWTLICRASKDAKDPVNRFKAACKKAEPPS
ncbi:hypothetical protein ACQY0O_003861 [Thecaphora frezii]